MGVLLIVGILLTFVNWCNALYINNNNALPCDFQDSVNITNGVLQTDGAIIFDGTKYPKEQYSNMDFILINGTTRATVDPHLRGCPCNVKPCIRLCCPLGSFVNMSSLKRGTILQQIPCYNHDAARHYESEILDQNNQTKMLQLDEHFSYAVLLSPIKFYKLKIFQITNVNMMIS